MFGLSGRKQAPPFLQTNRNGVPYYAILITCGLLSISVILNYIYKDATKVFVSIDILYDFKYYYMGDYSDVLFRFLKA